MPVKVEAGANADRNRADRREDHDHGGSPRRLTAPMSACTCADDLGTTTKPALWQKLCACASGHGGYTAKR